jgi:hypothetical protein
VWYSILLPGLILGSKLTYRSKQENHQSIGNHRASILQVVKTSEQLEPLSGTMTSFWRYQSYA